MFFRSEILSCTYIPLDWDSRVFPIPNLCVKQEYQHQMSASLHIRETRAQEGEEETLVQTISKPAKNRRLIPLPFNLALLSVLFVFTQCKFGDITIRAGPKLVFLKLSFSCSLPTGLQFSEKPKLKVSSFTIPEANVVIQIAQRHTVLSNLTQIFCQLQLIHFI